MFRCIPVAASADSISASSNNPASLTSRLGATIDVEKNHVRFLGDLVLNLWDCGGQDAFMDSYLTTQRSTIFSHVGVLIYVFDIESREMNKDLEYYTDCVQGLKQFSDDAEIFLLVHKMDLVREPKQATFDKKKQELIQASKGINVSIFGTSIYDESLYRVSPHTNPMFSPHAETKSHRPGQTSSTPSSQTPQSSQNTSPLSPQRATQQK